MKSKLLCETPPLNPKTRINTSKNSQLASKLVAGGEGWIRTSVLVRGQIYSLLPLTTRPPLRRTSNYSITMLLHFVRLCSIAFYYSLCVMASKFCLRYVVPMNRLGSMVYQKIVGSLEVAAPHEWCRRTIRRQGGWMVGLQHQNIATMCSCRLLNHGGLGLGMGAPQHEDADLRGLSDLRNDGVRECFPSLFCMAGGVAVFHRQTGV